MSLVKLKTIKRFYKLQVTDEPFFFSPWKTSLDVQGSCLLIQLCVVQM